MFQQNLIEEWKNSRPIAVEESIGPVKKYYAVYSAELLTENHILTLRKLTSAPINFIFPNEIRMALRMPSINSLYVNTGLTYGIIGKLFKEGDRGRSISINLKGLSDANTSSAQAKTIFELVRFYNEIEPNMSNAEISDKFVSTFEAPGNIILRFSTRNLLKDSLEIENYLMALADIHNIPPLMVYAEIRDHVTGEWSEPTNMEIENVTKIKNLWRAYKKIKSSEIATS